MRSAFGSIGLISENSSKPRTAVTKPGFRSTRFRMAPVPRTPDATPAQKLNCAAILSGMTLMDITFELQSRLTPEQLRALGGYANTYGLRRFRVDENSNRLSFEYDASRLKETEVVSVLRMARIPVVRRIQTGATADAV